MAKNECEKIIDQAIEQGHTGGPVAQHCKKCSECAAAVACLLWLRTGVSPASGLEPSTAYMAGIEQKISNVSILAAATFKVSVKMVVAALIATAIALSLLTGILSPTSSAPENKAKVSSIMGNGVVAETKDVTGENDAQSISTPIMQFQSPADDVDK